MAESAQQAVLGGSEALPEGTPQVRGYDFPPLGQPVDYERLLAAMAMSWWATRQPAHQHR
jgi:hypothetical protein